MTPLAHGIGFGAGFTGEGSGAGSAPPVLLNKLLHFHFDNPTPYKDEVTGENLTTSNVTTTTGLSNEAITGTASSSYQYLSSAMVNKLKFNWKTQPFTFELWRSGSGNSPLNKPALYLHYSSVNRTTISFNRAASNLIYIYIATSTATLVNGTFAIDDASALRHMTLSSDGTTCYVGINGTIVATFASSNLYDYSTTSLDTGCFDINNSYETVVFEEMRIMDACLYSGAIGSSFPLPTPPFD